MQGKSRQAIIRELQKTSLDVNLAVNNLLSRDDEEPEEADDDSYMQESYFPGGLFFAKSLSKFLTTSNLVANLNIQVPFYLIICEGKYIYNIMWVYLSMEY